LEFGFWDFPSKLSVTAAFYFSIPPEKERLRGNLMQQRRLRLGDILDDYCPRERRITNHAIVAMIDDEVKQTRCTTCDADHEYKQARVPPPRRKKESLVAAPTPQETPSTQTFTESVPVEEALLPEEPVVHHAEDAPAAAESENENENEIDESPAEDEGPVHRRLIRATLPRPEGQPPERKPPEFTRPGSRGREFNGNRAGGGGQRHGRGRRAARGAQGSFGGSSRFGTPRPNSPHGGQRQNGNRPGPGGGQRGGRPQGQSRGPGRKRGR
jgi:hypothetical protein